MNTDDEKNRHRKSLSVDGNNLPGLAHENALTISKNADVDGDYRSRKSSCSKIPAAGARSSDNAINWFEQSAWGSIVPLHSDARHSAPKPPGEAPAAPSTAIGQVPIECPKLTNDPLQGSLAAGRLVRRVLLVCPSVSGNHSAESDPFCDANKQFLSHGSDVFLGLYALVNGNFRRCLLDLPVEPVSGSLLGLEGGHK